MSWKDVPYQNQTTIREDDIMTHHKKPLDMKLDEILKQLEAGANNLKAFGDFKASSDVERSLYNNVMHHMACTLIDGAKLAEKLKGGSND